jgi:hypothetical protein
MPKSILYRFLVGLILCFVLAFLSACEKKMVDPQGTLKKQAERYWTERLINKNFKYTYEQELKEGLPSFETYDKKLKIVTRIPTRSLKVKEVKVDGKDGAVKILAKCQIKGAPTLLDIPMGDRWVIEGNRWKHILQVKFE